MMMIIVQYMASRSMVTIIILWHPDMLTMTRVATLKIHLLTKPLMKIGTVTGKTERQTASWEEEKFSCVG